MKEISISDKITVIGLIEDVEEYNLVLQSFNRQTYPNKQLLIITDSYLKKHIEGSHILIKKSDQNFSKKLKKTIIFATHNRELANRADYKLFISNGDIKRVNAR